MPLVEPSAIVAAVFDTLTLVNVASPVNSNNLICDGELVPKLPLLTKLLSETVRSRPEPPAVTARPFSANPVKLTWSTVRLALVATASLPSKRTPYWVEPVLVKLRLFSVTAPAPDSVLLTTKMSAPLPLTTGVVPTPLIVTASVIEMLDSLNGPALPSISTMLRPVAEFAKLTPAAIVENVPSRCWPVESNTRTGAPRLRSGPVAKSTVSIPHSVSVPSGEPPR